MSPSLDTVVTAKLTREQSEALTEIANYHKTTESELVRSMVVSLIRVFEDVRSHASTGASVDDLVGRSTRFALTQLVNLSPEELRRMADQFKEAAYQFAAVMESKPK